MDLVRVKTCSGQSMTSFLSFGLGLLSDIDIGSEALRVLGEARFFLFGFLCGISLKTYKTKVRYLRKGDTDWTLDEDDFVMIQSVVKPWLAESLNMAGRHFESLSDGVFWLFLVRKGISRRHLFSWMCTTERGSLTDYPYVTAVPVTSVVIEPSRSCSGYMTVDGENVEFGRLEAEILPGHGNVMASSRISAEK